MGKSIYDWTNVDAGNVIKPKPIEEPEKVVEQENNVVEKKLLKNRKNKNKYNKKQKMKI